MILPLKCAHTHPKGTLFITVIVEDSTVMGVTQQLSAISTNEGDMDTGGGGGERAEGGTPLLGTDRTLEPKNPFGSLSASTSVQHSQSPIMPNLIPNSTFGVSSGAIATGVSDSSRQLLGNSPSELSALVTTLTDRVHSRLPDVVLSRDQTGITSSGMSGSDSMQQHGNGTDERGTEQQDCNNLEGMMSSEDFGAGNIYPS